MAAPSAIATMQVGVACSAAAGQAFETSLRMQVGATVLDAIRASGVLLRFPALDISTRSVGIWGRACDLGSPLKHGDRVEIYRPLAMDPMQARRLRATRR
ncbi:MAG: RnfH family protein [Caldimonas sp.]